MHEECKYNLFAYNGNYIFPVIMTFVYDNEMHNAGDCIFLTYTRGSCTGVISMSLSTFKSNYI